MLPSRPTLTIERRDFLPDATLGLFLLDHHLTGWWSLELPWLQNRQDISCIPEGVYYARKHVSPTKGRVFWIQDVPARAFIYIHTINTVKDSLGCIGPGERLGKLCGLPAVLSSENTLNAMWERLPERFTVEITHR